MTAATAELVVDCRCALGECVLWDDRRSALFWTDITGRRLWMHRADAPPRHWSVPEKLGCFAFCEDGRLLIGLAKGLYLADIDAGDGAALRLSHLADVERGIDHTRVNDGRSDRSGNFVFGTKSDDDARPDGGFYQYSFRRGLRRLALGDAAIPNSICFSRDGGTMYYCDSRVPEIRCCDYDPDAASVSNARRFARVSAAGASPDGSVVDADGCVWNAQWGAAQVVRYGADGAERERVAVPAKNPSCPGFGGAALDRLFVSTAREDMSEAELAAMPQSGGIYGASIAGIRGLPESRVAAA